MSELGALRSMERLIAFAIALAALELLQGRAALRDDAVFAWPSLRRDFTHAPAPVRRLLDALLGYRPFVVLLVVQLLAAAALFLVPFRLGAPFLLLTTGLVGLRFRGTFNGGSDSMTAVVLTALSLARIGDTTITCRVGLGYAAAQLVLSYFVAGVAKLGQAEWRRGDALAQLLSLPAYAAPPSLRALLTSHPKLARVATVGVLAFECSFPIALLDLRAGIALLGLAGCFHLVNTLVLGLNRFFWAWVSAFPALLYWSARAGEA